LVVGWFAFGWTLKPGFFVQVLRLGGTYHASGDA
jgi:hypothetical protein